MSNNDGTYGDFANELQDEDQLDAHPYPGTEIGYDIQRDCGSGSYAEDGRREVREDRPIMNGENVLGSAAMYGPTEIGAVKKAVAKAAQAVKNAVVAKKTASPQVAAKHAAIAHRAVAAAEHAHASVPYAQGGRVEIGAGEDTLGNDALIGGDVAEPFESFMMGPERIGDDDELGAAAAADRPGYELGAAAAANRPGYELGAAAAADRPGYELGFGGFDDELGAAAAANRPGYELGFGGFDDELGESDTEDEFGSAAMYGPTEIGTHFPSQGAAELGAGYYPGEGASEIGAARAKAAVVKVVEKARDNRQPAPPMKAVDVDAPLEDTEDGFLSDIVLGATVAAPGKTEPFPLLSQLLLRAGANVEPRIVRVDTEESYKAFRTAQSPALSEVKEISNRIEAHITDPSAHELDSTDIDDDIADLVHLGEEAQAIEAEKRVELWMPKRFEGKIEAWRQGDMVCASIALPGKDGCVRICTSFEPVRKCVEEMLRHASETKDGTAVVGVLPAMGCVLGAGTVLKEMAAAAPAILARPEAKMKMPFMVRIEPKTAPNLAALVMLAASAKMGNTQAQDEWQKLANMSAPAVKQAMLEALTVAKAATEGC